MKAHAMRVLQYSVGTCALAVFPSSAFADSVTQPGFTTGIPLYAPAPEGLYLIAIPWISHVNSDPEATVTAATPFIFYQSPLVVAKARISAVLAPVYVSVKTKNGPRTSGFYNTYGGVQATWDLGNHWGAGFRASGWTKQSGRLAKPFWTVEPRAGLTYFDGKTHFTANLIYGIPLQSQNRETAPEYANLDITFTKTLKKWELGGVAFGSSDTTRPFAAYRKQSQFAVGPLIGYNFGPASAQFKFTSDLTQKGYGGTEQRIEANITVPIWVRKIS